MILLFLCVSGSALAAACKSTSQHGGIPKQKSTKYNPRMNVFQEVKAVTCKACDYTDYTQSSLCKTRGHRPKLVI